MGKRTDSPGLSAARIADQRAVIDRRVLAGAIADAVAAAGPVKARAQVVELLRGALATGRAEIARRLLAHPSAGHDCAEAQAFLVDQLVRTIHDAAKRTMLDGTGAKLRESAATGQPAAP